MPPPPTKMRTPMRRFLILYIVSAAWTLIANVALAEEKPGEQHAAKLDKQVRVELDYLLYLPKDYAKQDQWPLMLFLHGAGARGDDLEKVKKHGPPKLVAAGKDLPFVIVSPQCPTGKSWEPMELVTLIDDVSGRYKIDADRIYVTGIS